MICFLIRHYTVDFKNIVVIINSIKFFHSKIICGPNKNIKVKSSPALNSLGILPWKRKASFIFKALFFRVNTKRGVLFH